MSEYYKLQQDKDYSLNILWLPVSVDEEGRIRCAPFKQVISIEHLVGAMREYTVSIVPLEEA